MRAIRESAVVVLPRGHGIIDVFTGKGWDNHSVFKLIKGVPHLIKGFDPLTEEEYNKLREQLK